jgi:maleylacetate reductase
MNAIRDFTIHSPRQIYFGAGRINVLAEWVVPLERVMLVTGENVARTPHVFQVKSLLGEKLCGTFEAMPSPTDHPAVGAALDLARKAGAQAIVSLGGSSTIDGGKGISRGLGWPPHIAIPTTYGGSEVTHVFGVVDPEKKIKDVFVGSECLPSHVIYDPNLTVTLPAAVTAGSGINALAHCIEAYYCSANPINRAFCSIGIEWIMKSLAACVKNPGDLDARTGMMLGSYAAGTAVCNGFIGLHHGVCHFIGPTYGISHGQANSIMLPYVMQYNLDGIPGEMAAIARMMGLDPGDKGNMEAGQMAIDAVIELEEKIGAPRHLRDFGVREDTFEELAKKALNSRAVQNNPKPIKDYRQIVEVLRMAL